MKKHIPKRYLYIVYASIAILVAILVYLAFLLAMQYRYLAREQLVHGKHVQIANFRKQHVLTIKDLSLIESWMTFDYITVAFKVPATVLKESLNIDDSRFPRITIFRYARSHGLNESEFTLRVMEAVGKYLIDTKVN